MSSERVEFTSSFEDVEFEVEAVIYDGEIDEFTVKIGETIVTEVLREDIVDKLTDEALYQASDECKQLTKADELWATKGEF